MYHKEAFRIPLEGTKDSPPSEVNMRDDRLAFLVMFCGMILVKQEKATLAETMSALPLHGGARVLARKIAGAGSLQRFLPAANAASM